VTRRVLAITDHSEQRLVLAVQRFGLTAVPISQYNFGPRRRGNALQNGTFTISIRKEGAVSVLDVVGRLTSFEVSALRDAISRLLKEGRKNIVLNLGALDYLDSSGIGELARSYVSVVKKGGAMKVVGLSAKVEEVLKITQLFRVFPEFPSEEEAVDSFRCPGYEGKT
jgi:anti-sigma B factor antagonist